MEPHMPGGRDTYKAVWQYGREPIYNLQASRDKLSFLDGKGGIREEEEERRFM